MGVLGCPLRGTHTGEGLWGLVKYPTRLSTERFLRNRRCNQEMWITRGS